MCDLAGDLLESTVLLLQAILIAGFRARNIDAASETVELPGVEHARHMVGVAGRLRYRQAPGGLPQDQIAAVGTHVEECPDLAVRAAHDDDGFARNRQGPEVERIGQLGFLNGHEPHFLPDLLELLLENTLVAVDSTVDIRNCPTAVALDLVPLRRHYILLVVCPPHAIAAPPFPKS